MTKENRRTIIVIAGLLVSIPVVHAVARLSTAIFPDQGNPAAGMIVFTIWTGVALLASLSAAVAAGIRASRPKPPAGDAP